MRTAVKLRSAFGLFALVVSAGACLAQTGGASISDLPEIRVQRPGPITPVMICEELGRAVEASVKEMAYYDQAELGTPEAEITNRKLSMVAEASKAQSNLLLMQSNKCALPKQPVSPRAYFHAAFACVHKTPKSGSGYIPECDRAKWVRSSD